MRNLRVRDLMDISVSSVIVAKIVYELSCEISDDYTRELFYNLSPQSQERRYIEDYEKKVCTETENAFIWNESKKLFSYFCWYVTEICEKNGMRMYKGECNINRKMFESFFENDFKNIDRKQIAEFKCGVRPKKHELVESAVKVVLAETLNTEIKDID